MEKDKDAEKTWKTKKLNGLQTERETKQKVRGKRKQLCYLASL